MQLQINAPEIKTVYEQQLFNGKNFHVFIYNKTESISGLHQHDYYEFTLVLTGRYYQEINGKRVLLERGDFVFIPLDRTTKVFMILVRQGSLTSASVNVFLNSTITRYCHFVSLHRRSIGRITRFLPILKRLLHHLIFARADWMNL